jgi:hypothetical protein
MMLRDINDGEPGFINRVVSCEGNTYASVSKVKGEQRSLSRPKKKQTMKALATMGEEVPTDRSESGMQEPTPQGTDAYICTIHKICERNRCTIDVSFLVCGHRAEQRNPQA